MNNIDLTNVEEIVTYLKECDDLYFNTEKTLITDPEYDILKRTAFRLNSNHPYFLQVGADVRGGKINLPYPMYGLDQVYENEIHTWVSKHALSDNDVVLSDKLDGQSALLIFADKDGDGHAEFIMAYSRGNTLQGADITRNAKHLNFPKVIKDCTLFVCRGELIMKNDLFNKKYLGKYSTARAMVAGCMNRKETDQNILKDFDLVAYSVLEIASSTIASKNLKKMQALTLLKNYGFNIPFIQIMKGSTLTDSLLSDSIKNSTKSSQYELDGVVITDDKTNQSIKYKILDSNFIVVSRCKDVHYDISKWGARKPVVEIEPVKLFGTIVTFATGFNAKYIVDHCIGPGSLVRITKSGNVIPFILGVDSPSAAGIPKLPDGDNEWNDTGVDLIIKDAENHPMVKFKQILDFVETLDVDLLKEATLKLLFDKFKLWNESYENIISIIFEMLEVEWLQVVGANGKKIFDSLQRRLNNMKLEVFLGSLKYCGFGFGVRKAKQLLSQIDAATVWTLSEKDIIDLDGFDEKLAIRICKGLKLSKKLLDDNSHFITFSKNIKTNELENIAVVFTGFRDGILEEKIEKMGGKVQTGVSKKTTYLISVDGDTNSGKGKKAKELKVPVLTIDEFKSKFNL